LHIFIKPAAGRGSAGINDASVVHSYDQLVSGVRDFGRIDTLLTEEGPVLLEGNTFAGLMCTPKEKPHKIILMIELGDLREGILPADVEPTVEETIGLEGVELSWQSSPG